MHSQPATSLESTSHIDLQCIPHSPVPQMPFLVPVQITPQKWMRDSWVQGGVVFEGEKGNYFI